MLSKEQREVVALALHTSARSIEPICVRELLDTCDELEQELADLKKLDIEIDRQRAEAQRNAEAAEAELSILRPIANAAREVVRIEKRTTQGALEEQRNAEADVKLLAATCRVVCDWNYGGHADNFCLRTGLPREQYDRLVGDKP